ISQLFVSIRPAELNTEDANEELAALVASAPGFYARVMEQVETRQRVRSTFAGFLSLDFSLGRRLVLSSLLTLVVLGGWLVSRETGYSRGPSPDSILAQQNDPGFESASGPDNMLVTLTSYEH